MIDYPSLALVLRQLFVGLRLNLSLSGWSGPGLGFRFLCCGRVRFGLVEKAFENIQIAVQHRAKFLAQLRLRGVQFFDGGPRLGTDVINGKTTDDQAANHLVKFGANFGSGGTQNLFLDLLNGLRIDSLRLDLSGEILRSGLRFWRDQ